MTYSYLKSGVDIKAAGALVEIIKNATNSKQIGGFAGLFEHSAFDDYYLAACVDGMGTKIIPLIERKDTKTIANDLFAMNINDLICCGAQPLFFLDYIALNRLDTEFTARLICDLDNILKKYNCVLLGGETSELGDLILKDNFDVSGFLTGIVKKDRLLSKDNVRRGDYIVALKSGGPHSNGFTLIRKLHNDGLLSDELFEQSLAPVSIYFDIISKLNKMSLINACANITGGGILSNVARSIPEGLRADIDLSTVKLSPLFKKIADITGLDEAFNVFNMGVGFCVICSEENLKQVISLADMYSPFILGRVV